MKLVLFAALLLLSACAAPPTVLVKCAEVIEYSAEYQDKIFAEKKTLKSDSVLHRVLDDFKHMRDKARACKNG